MESPNKWVGRTEDWTTTTCNSCSVGCTISIGTRGGRGVIVKPDRMNPVNADQICVRGRFHYDAVADRDRLSKHYVRRGPGAPQMPAHYGELVAWSADQLKTIIAQHGAASVAVLGSPFSTNEENFLAQKLARDVIGTPHVDYSGAATDRAAARAVEAALGTSAPGADGMNIGRSDVVIVIADDLESSHNVFALRAKDAVVGNPAAPRHGKLLLISHLWGEMADFAEPYGGVWLRPRPRLEPLVVDALIAGDAPGMPPAGDGDVTRALSILEEARDPAKVVSILYAVPRAGEAAARAGAASAARLALALRGDRAAESLFVLPVEANSNGARDMGVDPGRLPGGAAASQAGFTFAQMVDAAIAGNLKAMVVVGDNPLMFAPDSARVRQALASLDLLIVIDSLMTDTAKLAHALFADVPAYGKTGTFSNAERRVNRLHAALDAAGDARPALLALTDLANAVAGADTWAYAHPDAVTDEIAQSVPGYEPFASRSNRWGKARAAVSPGTGAVPEAANVSGTTPVPGEGQLVLTTGRTLFTSFEGAAIHAPDADKLHREEFVEIHPADAAAMGIGDEQPITLAGDSAELSVRCKISERVQEGVVFVPAYFDGGAVMTLFPADGSLPLVRVKVAATA
jgi:predicted molibdopterin-dependent oxidoreductase YjgC